jgi:HEAT repeat protein
MERQLFFAGTHGHAGPPWRQRMRLFEEHSFAGGPELPPQDEPLGDLLTADDKMAFWEASLERIQRAVISGQPGSGKTCLLRHLACKQARHWHEQLDARRCRVEDVVFPVFVSLADVSANGGSFAAALVAQAARRRSDSFRRFLYEHLHARAAWLFLDGWDEVPRKQRADLACELGALIEKHALLRIVVSTRLDGLPAFLEDLPTANLRIFQLAGLTVPQVRGFVRSWFVRRKQGARLARMLVEELRSEPYLMELTQLPLFLRILCENAEQQGSLRVERRRAQICERFCLNLVSISLARRRDMRPVDIKPEDAAPYLDILGWLAWRAENDGIQSLSGIWLHDGVSAWLAEQRRIASPNELANRTPADLVAALRRTGLLLPAGFLASGAVRFDHALVRQYLAARDWARRARVDWNAVSGEIRSRIQNPAWAPTLVFLAGLLDDRVALLALLDTVPNDVLGYQLFFKVACVLEAGVPAAERAQIAPHLLDLFRRRIRSGTLSVVPEAAGLLREWVRAEQQQADGLEVGAATLSNEISALLREPPARGSGTLAAGLSLVAGPLVAEPLVLKSLLGMAAGDSGLDAQCFAIEVLGACPAPSLPVLNVLLDGTASTTPGVSMLAASALARLATCVEPESSLTSLLLERLDSPTWEQCRAVAETLAEILSAGAPPHVLALLRRKADDPAVGWWIRAAAGRALGACVTQDPVGVVDTLARALGPGAEVRLARATARTVLRWKLPQTPALVDRLIERLSEGDECEMQAAYALGALCEPPFAGRIAASLWKTALTGGASSARIVGRALGAVLEGFPDAAPEVVNRVQEALNSPFEADQLRAAAVLSHVGLAFPHGLHMVPALVRVVRDNDAAPMLRELAASALGLLSGDDRQAAQLAVEPLVDRLAVDGDRGVRAAAALSLGRLARMEDEIPEIGTALIRAAETDRDLSVRQQAAVAFGLFDTHAASAAGANRMLDAALATLLDAEAPCANRLLARVVGRLWPLAAGGLPRMARLEHALKNERSIVVEAAIAAIQEIGAAAVSANAFAGLIALLDNLQTSVRQAAAAALARFGRAGLRAYGDPLQLRRPYGQS